MDVVNIDGNIKYNFDNKEKYIIFVYEN